MATYVIKRIYDAVSPDDGYRILVDRLWPRGVSKERAALDLWLKEIAPSPELRTWFGHKPERFKEFAIRYEQELSHNPAVANVKSAARNHSTVTLLYAAHDADNNHAKVLLKHLER
jgi:uncharacterized protein YeaO (DUF488 family)